MLKDSHLNFNRRYTFIAIWFLILSLVACVNQNESSRLQSDDPDDSTLIQLRNHLDEPEYYCVDVPGFGSSLDLEGALTAHTCKPNAEDELFIFNQPDSGQLYMPAYDLCMTADSQNPGTELILTACNDSQQQRFSFNEDGTIQFQNNASESLCLSVSDEAGEPTGGPSHLRRDLSLELCRSVDSARSQWSMPGPVIP